MDIEYLKHFIELAVCQNFTRAAEHLHISQPTISRHILNLENELGMELYEHGKKNFTLTEAGEVFYEGALEIVHKYDLLRGRMESLALPSSNKTGTLSIGYTGTFFLDMLSTPISRFSKHYPYVDIILNMASALEISRLLREKNLDIIYTILTEDHYETPNIVYQNYIDGYLQILLPSSHRLASLDTVPTAELQGESFVLYIPQGTTIYDDMMTRFFFRNNIPSSNITQVSSMQNMLLQVSAGKGIGICLTFSQVDSIESVKIKDLSDCLVDYHIVLAYRKDNTNPFLPLYIREADQAKRVMPYT